MACTWENEMFFGKVKSLKENLARKIRIFHRTTKPTYKMDKFRQLFLFTKSVTFLFSNFIKKIKAYIFQWCHRRTKDHDPLAYRDQVWAIIRLRISKKIKHEKNLKKFQKTQNAQKIQKKFDKKVLFQKKLP